MVNRTTQRDPTQTRERITEDDVQHGDVKRTLQDLLVGATFYFNSGRDESKMTPTQLRDKKFIEKYDMTYGVGQTIKRPKTKDFPVFWGPL